MRIPPLPRRTAASVTEASRRVIPARLRTAGVRAIDQAMSSRPASVFQLFAALAAILLGQLACTSRGENLSGTGGGAPGTRGTGGAGGASGGSADAGSGIGGSLSGADAGRNDAAVDLARAADAAADVPIGPRPPVTAAPGATLVKVNPGARHQTFEGWGTSLCWWANNVGGWAPASRDALVDLLVDPVNGLAYNVFRYNIGGGENPAHEHMGQFHEMPTFEPSAGTFTWDADANQRAVLQRIVERGTGLVLEAFSNSPPYWMTNSGCASGNTDGSNNLRSDSYGPFASYLAEVVKHFRDSFGISFRTLEPLNEPNATWWTANGGQEGCHFDGASQQTLIKAVGAALTAAGVTGTRVSASDENSIDDVNTIVRGYDAATAGYLTQINVHSYAGTRRAEVRALATSMGKRLWQSESGPLNVTLADDSAAAIFMAGRIITDLRDLRPEAWVDWQAADPSRNWASFAVNNARQTFTLLKRFYMHAGFSRYIRPGATFVDIDNADMVAAVAADGALLAVVARNGDAAASRTFTFDLTAVPSVGAAIEVHRTSRTENLVALPSIPVASWSFTATLPPGTVTTFVVPAR
jgi:O-glycosyl hydrolase